MNFLKKNEGRLCRRALRVLLMIALGTVMTAANAHAGLILDGIVGDAQITSAGTVSVPVVWQDGGGDAWWSADGGATDVQWNNLAPDVAQFGVAQADPASYVTINGTVVVAGINQVNICNPTGGTVQFSGTNPVINQTSNMSWQTQFETTAAQSLTIQNAVGAGANFYFEPSGLTTRGVFEGPVTFGSASGYIITNIRGTGLLGGTGSVTVANNSSLLFDNRSSNPVITIDKPITIQGIGTPGASAANSGVIRVAAGTVGLASTVNLNGPVTLAGNSKIRLWSATTSGASVTPLTVNGAITGDYDLTVETAAGGSSASSVSRFTNANNSVRNLFVVGSGSSSATRKTYLSIDAPMTVTQRVTVTNNRLWIDHTGTRTGALNTPLISLDASSLLYLNDISATNPLTMPANQIIEGIGTIAGAITVPATSSLSPGVGSNIGTLITYYGDLTSGGNLMWQMGAALKDNSTSGAVAGVDWDKLTSNGYLNLGGTSKITLDFGKLVGTDPNSSDPYWTTPHTWTVATGVAPTQAFARINDSLTNYASYSSGYFSTAVDGNNVNLTFTPVPEPTTLAMLAGLVSLLAVYVIRKR
jgi:hypothetical protein